MSKPLTTLQRVLFAYESRKFEVVEHGWIFTTLPARKAGETQQLEDSPTHEYFRIFTGIIKQARTQKYIYQEYLLLSRRKG